MVNLNRHYAYEQLRAVRAQMRAGGEPMTGWDLAIGLESYSERGMVYDDEIRAMITQGVRPDGSHMLPPMGYGYYANTRPEDIDAIILFLRQLPPLPDQG